MLVTNLVPTRELQGFARAIHREQDENRFSLTRWLPNRDNPGGTIDFKLFVGQLNQPRYVPYRAWDAESPIQPRQAMSAKQGELAALGAKKVIGEELSIRLRNRGTGLSQQIIDAIYDDTAELVRGVAERLEAARGELMVTGKLTISENGFAPTAIDWSRDASMSVSASTVWTNHAAATPLTDERTWISTYRDLNGFDPGAILMAQARVDDLMLNAEYRALATASNGGTPAILTLDSVNVIRRSFGLPPIVVYDVKVRDTTNTLTRVIAADKVLFLPPPSQTAGATLHAPTAASVLLSDAREISQDEMTGITVTTHTTDDPVATWTHVDAIAMPVAPNVNYFMVADVAA